MNWINALYATYSNYDAGAPEVNGGAPTVYFAEPVWPCNVRDAAERLLGEVTQFFRAVGQLLAGGRRMLADAFQNLRAGGYGAEPTGLDTDWIALEALDLPGHAGQIVLGALLLPWQRELYESSSALVLPEAERGKLPRSYRRLHQHDESRFNEKLLTTGLAGILPESELLYHECREVRGKFFPCLNPQR